MCHVCYACACTSICVRIVLKQLIDPFKAEEPEGKRLLRSSLECDSRNASFLRKLQQADRLTSGIYSPETRLR